MDQYVVCYRIRLTKDGKTSILFAGPYSLDEVIPKRQELLRSPDVTDAYIREATP